MSNNNNNGTVDKAQRRYLPPAVILEETSTLPAARRAVVIICSFLVLALIWGFITQVDETANAMGQVIPRGQVAVVQHLEGGIVEKILVKNGDKVIAGKTILAKLDPIAAKSELEEMQAREISLMVDAERLRSFVDEREDSFSEIISRAVKRHQETTSSKQDIQDMLNDDRLLFKLQNRARNDQREVVKSQIRQLEEESKQLDKQRETLEAHVQLLEQEKTMYKKLGSVSKRDFLDVLRQVNRANGDLMQMNGQISKNREALNGAKQRLNELNSNLKETAVKQLDDINSQLAQLRKTVIRLQDRVKRLNMVAPINGTVSGLLVTNGAVISPGSKLMEIVPAKRDLVVEARIKPQERGHLKEGDNVKIKVLTYNFARYGTLPGKLESISASTSKDEKGELYYNAIIKPEKEYLGKRKGAMPILPGMTVQADIVTGSKSLIAYLMKPVHRAMKSSFSER